MTIAASGCIPEFLKKRPLEQYTLVAPHTEDGAPIAPRPPVLTGSLVIRPYVAQGIYDRPGIVYRVDDFQLSSYPNREWAIPLRDMLGAITEEALRSRSLTPETATFDARAARTSDYQWRGTVREFEEVNRARQVLAAVHLEVEIIRTANDSVIWKGSERIERAVPPPTNSMQRVVETLSALTADALTRLIDRARSDLGTPAAGTARVPE